MSPLSVSVQTMLQCVKQLLEHGTEHRLKAIKHVSEKAETICSEGGFLYRPRTVGSDNAAMRKELRVMEQKPQQREDAQTVTS